MPPPIPETRGPTLSSPGAPGRPGRLHGFVLLITLATGLLLFVWKLGSTGLVDETPPLFAAAARAMAETGDWLIPRVNGLPRYDKPPLVYWLMGALYALPGQARWNPLGSWAAALPSALACVTVMVALADTLLRWPQAADPEGAGGSPAAPVSPASAPSGASPAVQALAAALAFGLSPLVLVWGRTPVSDSLFSGLLALTLLLLWRRYAAARGAWWPAWAVLGLAVLTKGPVAIVLVAITLALFAGLQGQRRELMRRLRPGRGLLLCGVLSAPWYGLALLAEGRPFWDSFFGYHNLQRFTSVVNHHLQPWWFFGPVLLIASLPFSPLLLLGLVRALGPLPWRPSLARPVAAPLSLGRFCACWLVAVGAFFTVASTKLPSYWLPAVPAAAVLIALASPGAPLGGTGGGDRASRWAWRATLLLTALIAAVFFAGPWLVGWIRDPELPTLPAELLRGGLLPLAGLCWLAAALLGWAFSWRRHPARLLALQVPLVLFVPLALLPSWVLGDRLRGQPVRAMAVSVNRQARPGESLAMVGILKPSLHYYSRRVVLYEGIQPGALRNLSDRLRREQRRGQWPSPPERHPTVLVVIDQQTAQAPHWRDLDPVELDRAGLYRLWRLDRRRLEERAAQLAAAGVPLEWHRPVPERY
ncbi:MAG: glycosyltransferase family 39 protein [Cyanobacteriota bacterium]|nr:glycosyltransferase family 39 protein [Cyanobacteriota bacterium]